MLLRWFRPQSGGKDRASTLAPACGRTPEEALIAADRRYAEDLVPGTVYDLGSYLVTAEELRAFAHQWDPQPIHLDETSATAGHYGGLIASGVHTIAIVQRLAVLGAYSQWAIFAGRALRDVQFLLPVRAGMQLDVRLIIRAVELSRPERGLVHLEAEARHEGRLVLRMQVETWVLRTGAEPVPLPS